MAPAIKKRKTNNAVDKFLCFCCDSEKLSNQFPDYNPTPACDHLINTCKTCLKKWVEVKVESASFATSGEGDKIFGVKCPQCDEIMRNINIEIAATKRVHKRFDELERKHIGETTPGWRWCLAPFCRAGQVHERKVPLVSQPSRKKPRTKAEPETTPDSEICTCHLCGAKACVDCDRPWHEGETCVEYQARIKDRVEEEDKALRRIRIKTRGCPNPDCKTRIEKNGGCPMVHCTVCRSLFCWLCQELVREGRCACMRVLS